MSLVSDLRASINPILGIRDELGAALKAVSIVTRTWSGSQPGDGDATETKVAISPAPRTVEFFDDYRIKDGGAIKQGDLMLKMISRQSYPSRTDVDCNSGSGNVEKFYEIGSELYQVIMVRENHLTWDVQLRKISDQTRYPAP